MTPSPVCWHQPLRSLLFSGILSLSAVPALAQRMPIADETLGNERSRVSPDQVIDRLPINTITGGAQRGTHLFHSFREFNRLVGK